MAAVLSRAVVFSRRRPPSPNKLWPGDGSVKCGAITIKPRARGAFQLADRQTPPAASQIPHVQRDLRHKPPPDRAPATLSLPPPERPPGPPKTPRKRPTSLFLSVPKAVRVNGHRNEKMIGGGVSGTPGTLFRPLELTDEAVWPGHHPSRWKPVVPASGRPSAGKKRPRPRLSIPRLRDYSPRAGPSYSPPRRNRRDRGTHG